MIKFYAQASAYCTIFRCQCLICLAYIAPVFLAIPNMLALAIKPRFNETNCGLTKEIKAMGTRLELEETEQYVISHSCMAKGNNYFLSKINIWIYSLVLKVVPCMVLTIFTGFLIKELCKAKQRSVRLSTRTLTYRQNRLNKQQNRTTGLLIVILVMFLISEFPSGIMGVLWAIHGNYFYHDCYHPLGELMDMMALINSAVSFIPYCLMSQEFRNTIAKYPFAMKKCTFPLKQCALCYKRRDQSSQPKMQKGGGKSNIMVMVPRDSTVISNNTKIVATHTF